jgi:very-short-patch-repair endonuclease
MKRSAGLDRTGLARILAAQYLVISRRQVLALGITERALQHRLRIGGPWQRLLPGVFLTVTGTPTTDQKNVAALLYAGAGSLITGTAALKWWGVRAPYTSVIDVLLPAAKQRKSAEFVRIHVTTRMPEQVTAAGPLRFAPVARAVADTARGLTRLADVRALVAAVVQQGKCSPDLLAAELEDGPIQGSALLRLAISDTGAGIRSNPEADLRDLIRHAGLPAPVFNAKLYLGDQFIASPDAWWEQSGLAAEVDSREYHLSPQDHERTLARHARMAACGITVLHFTPRQIRTQPAMVLTSIKSVLAANRNRPPLRIRAVPPSNPPKRTETPVSSR